MAKHKSYRKLVAGTMTAAMVASVVAPISSLAADVKFTDVPAGHWSEEAINAMAAKGIIAGEGNNKFGFGKDVTRGQVATFIVKAKGLQNETATHSFTDVKGSDYEKFVAIAANKGIMAGLGGSKFGTNDKLTRAQLAQVLVNAYGLKLDENNKKTFNDIDGLGWATAKSSIEIIASLGITAGKGNGKFAPNDTVTREEAAQFIYKAMNHVADPVVTSVKAINAKKIEVKFNKEVSKDAAQNINNYTVVGVDGFVTATLQEDGKTVVLTSNTAIKNDTTFVVTVNEIATKADVNVKTKKFTTTLTFSDTVRPAYSSITYPKPGVAELQFSEELSTEGNVVVYDGLVESTTVTKKLEGNKIVLGNLELNKEYKVVITGAKDQSNNLISAPVQVTVKSSVSDTVKPVVASIASQGINTVKVQFSEAIQAVGGVYATLKVNGQSATGTLAQSFDEKTNILTVSGIDGIKNGEVKSITVEGFKDLANHAGNSVTKVIAFSTAAPALQSTQVVKEGNDTFAVLTFDKAVPAIATEVDASYVTSENIYRTTKLPATVNVDKKQIKLKLNSAEAGAYTVAFAAGQITDGQTSNSKSVEVKFNVGTNVDSTTPEVSSVFLPGDTLPNTNTTVQAGTVYVKYSKPMAASALNVDNYTIDGSTVFTNPIFVNDKTLVKLTIKDSSMTVSGDRNFSISNSVKGENNVALKSYNTVKRFEENIKPVLTSALLLDDQTIELSFSELLGTTGFDNQDNDFLVTVGGNKNAVTAVVDGTTNDNKVRISLGSKITADQLVNSAITVKTTDKTDITDKVGNLLTANTLMNVAK
jgi:hypothetical protein